MSVQNRNISAWILGWQIESKIDRGESRKSASTLGFHPPRVAQHCRGTR